MSILELRILPPLAIGRLGEAAEALEAFDLEINPDQPLDYRRIVPRESFEIDPASGAITRCYVPATIRFKDDNHKVRPVAPFLEVFARTSEAPDELVPLTTDLLLAKNLCLADLHWEVSLGNIKIFRRTNDIRDKIHANLFDLKDHQRHAMEGECPNFVTGKKLPLGHVQFIKPSADFPEVRLRFTPAGGIVYGSDLRRHVSKAVTQADPVITCTERILYDKEKGIWRGYSESASPTLTNPAQIYAGYLNDDGNQVSWGYLDDECDGVVRVFLKQGGVTLRAQATIGAGPPAYAPDTLPVRVISDEMEQLLYGPHVQEEMVSLDAATELVFRALETVRLMNTAVMNGNPVYGRLNVASTMVRQNTNDFERYYEPIAASSLVDNLALRQLHERVFSTLAAGGAPWFSEVMRKPEEIGDLSAKALRKMPALMRGADGRSLTLTRRQIDMVIKAAKNAMFAINNPKPDGATR
jgi:hypothetical protein